MVTRDIDFIFSAHGRSVLLMSEETGISMSIQKVH